MVEITSEEQNKIKRIYFFFEKKSEDSLRDLWDNIKHTNIQIIGVPEDEKKKEYEKNFEEIRVENFPNMEKGLSIKSKRHKSPIQDKPKKKHTKSHTNQTNKD